VLAVCGAALVVDAARPDGDVTFIAAGGVAILAGIVLLAPALVRLAGTIAGSLPPAARLAVRHAARHHVRTAAAMAAVTAVVGGSAAIVLVSAAPREAAALRRDARPGQVLLDPAAAATLGPDGLRRFAAALPARATVELSTVDSATAAVPLPPDGAAPGLSFEQNGIAVGGPEVIALVTGRPATGAETAALRDGAVAFNDTLVTGGRVTVLAGGRTQALTAAVAVRGTYYARLPGLLVTPATAQRLGLHASVTAVVVDTGRVPSAGELAAAERVLLQAQFDAAEPPATPLRAGVAADGGPDRSTGAMFWILAALSAIVTAAASLIAVGLTAAELRGDLRTMVAVGATPRTRRRLLTTQAVLIVGLATPLGLLAGIAPAAGFVAYSVDVHWQTPWGSLLLLLVLPPLLAAALTGTQHRTR